MSYSVYHYLWKIRELKNGKYPLKLVVDIDNVRKNYKTDYSFTKDQWVKLNGPKLRDQDLKGTKDQLSNKIKEIKSILAKIEFPTHQGFEKIYNQKRLKKNQRVRYWFNVYYYELEAQNKPYSSLRLLKTAINSLESYKSNLNLQHITSKFLDNYEAWLLNEKKVSSTTVGIYITRLRIIYNFAIAEGVISKDLYPFGKQKGGYVIKTSRARKPSLSLAQVELLAKFKFKNTGEEFARDMWLLLYLLNGSNVIDICRLRYKNIDFNEKTFYYIRTKTRDTRSIINTIQGGLNPDAEKIIKKYGNSDKSPDNYVFPFLNELKGEELNHLVKEYHIKNQLLKKINRDLKPIKDKLNISFNLTVKMARHTFASVLHYDLNYPIAMVGQAMDHSSSSVTDHYFSGMDRAQQKEMNLGLLSTKPQKKIKHE